MIHKVNLEREETVCLDWCLALCQYKVSLQKYKVSVFLRRSYKFQRWPRQTQAPLPVYNRHIAECTKCLTLVEEREAPGGVVGSAAKVPQMRLKFLFKAQTRRGHWIHSTLLPTPSVCVIFHQINPAWPREKNLVWIKKKNTSISVLYGVVDHGNHCTMDLSSALSLLEAYLFVAICSSFRPSKVADCFGHCCGQV